ncbi:hypothetical protein [Mycolicibacterium smegmatis]|uniref:hypothetical protein n=1 Tax=Mycolicibacterium smegmatis TaxID=1772 RepID=UPI0013031DA6|nr:hypothetical protein [Mycolicibacterium smegmatis]ULN33625.1 hypothetical protein KZ781_22815 [Mycolicibacterium smegmatis]
MDSGSLPGSTRTDSRRTRGMRLRVTDPDRTGRGPEVRGSGDEPARDGVDAIRARRA